MVSLTIDNKAVQAAKGATILAAARSAGIIIPTLCYLEDLCDVGACRVCVVEIEGNDRLAAACNTVAEDGMVIHTNSRRVKEARLVNIQLAVSAHRDDCTSCVRNLNCSLRKLVGELNVLDAPYKKQYHADKWPQDYPLIRDGSKCINCMRCVQVCDKLQSLGVWDLHGSGAGLMPGVKGNADISASDCALCGQCITKCPVGALRARDDTDKVLRALDDPSTVVVVQVAPAVRAAWGEEFGLDRSDATVGRLVAAIRALGADYVLDTDFAADLTIMEEGAELLERLSNKDKYRWPMFTSCCPGWIRFLKTQYPQLAPQLSTAKSPQQMFGAAVKTWYAKRSNIDPDKVFSVSIMPCVAKKFEGSLDVMRDARHGQDVDAVLTVRELVRLLRLSFINVPELEDEEFDDLLGEGTGAAVIFGATGGVMEAALRSVYFLATGSNPDPDLFSVVRGGHGWREASAEINGSPVRVAVASGLSNARELIEKIKSGEAEYDFVEIMACPGGCVGGGGHPISADGGHAPTTQRSHTLYELDKSSAVRFSHENPSVKKAYEEFFEKPLSHVSHELLHTHHDDWKIHG